ncbi:MAG: class I SAM-dependent methyltransferase [Phycisphaerales bacterium]
MSADSPTPAPCSVAAPTLNRAVSSRAPTDDDEQDRLLCERYRAWAPAYDRAFASYSETTLAKALEFLGEPLPKRVLDLACGTGLLGERLLRACPTMQLVGIDRSREMLDRAQERLGKRGDATLIVGRAEQLPLANRSVDAVVVANAFHLISDPYSSLNECRRVLVPGGRLVIVDWCGDAMPMRILALALRATQRLRRDIRGVAAMRDLLRTAQFSGIRTERFTARPMWGLMAISATRPA